MTTTTAATPSGFPRALLARPAEERLAYFRDYTVAHPHLKAADAALAAALAEPGDAGLVLVYGPTGVGKTTLLRRTRQRLTVAALPALAGDPGTIPVAAVEAAGPDERSFNLRDFFERSLLALDEPLVADKRLAPPPAPLAGRHDRPTRVVRRALEGALTHRQVRAFLVDEAQHLAKVGSGHRLEDHLDCLKSLANMTGTTYVLLGTYGLLAFRNLSDQLSRRSLDIHFPRYRLEAAGEADAFRAVVWAFQRHLPLAEEPDLLGRWAFCYERAVGCVGVLKQWLTRALADALARGVPTLTAADLDRHALTISQCVTMGTATRQGEATLAEGDGERRKLLALLGLPLPDERQAPGAPPPRGPVGRRKPGRDPVGAVAHAD